MAAASAEMPVKPKIPATIDMTKKNRAHFNIVKPLFKTPYNPALKSWTPIKGN